VNEPAPLSKQWSVEEKGSILDYLHSDIPADEAKAVCYYEYARASETLRQARKQYDLDDPENSSLIIARRFSRWVSDQVRSCFLAVQKFSWIGVARPNRRGARKLPAFVQTNELVAWKISNFQDLMQ